MGSFPFVVDGNDAAASDSVRGGLFNCSNYWKDTLNASPFVQSIVQEGYRIPFNSIPDSCFLKNNKSARDHPEFVSGAICDLLEGGYIEEHSQPPYCINPLSVAKGKKLRLVLDLRNINGHLRKQSFKYEDLRSLSQLFEEKFWFFTWDLKSGYHHVDIYFAHRKFLGFSWLFDGTMRYFTFSVLPFGLSSACFCFTKLLRPLVKRWRYMSHAAFVYLDDGISGHKSRLDAFAASTIQKRDLLLAGLKTNDEKSHWEPMQIGEWLGLIINTVNFHFEIPPRKLEKVKSSIEFILSSDYVSFRELAKVAGFINSLFLAVGPPVRIFTRQLFYTISQRGSWSENLDYMPPLLVEELRFWLNNLSYLNGYRILPKVSSEPLHIFTDASGVGFGGYIASLRELNIHGHWSPEQSVRSSTYRELLAILLVLESAVNYLKHKKVKVFSDCQSACRIAQVGSRIVDLHKIAVDIFHLCFVNDIMLEIQWIPRSMNQLADDLSKTLDLDDWQLNPKLFSMLHKKWGPFTVDRFASNYNKQLQRFNSRFWCPETEAVDSFTQNWSSELNWACPPVSLIISVIRHMSVCKAKGTLIVPRWPSAIFWPLIMPEPGRFAPFIRESLILPKLVQMCIPGEGQVIVYQKKPSVFMGTPAFDMLALRIEF